ncbi:MAG: HAD family hydrolase [Candidatus Nanohaloarchaea archaeon]
MPHKNAVIFDCWHTLFRNSGEDPVEELAEITGNSKEDREFLKTVEKNLMTEEQEGEKLRNAIRRTFNELGASAESGEVSRVFRMFKDTTKSIEPFPEALNILESLGEDYRLGLVTNTFYISQKQLEEQFEIGSYFDAMFLSCQEGVIKPDSEAFRTTIERLGVEKEEAVMVGDSLEDDVRAARDFGMDAILVDRDGSVSRAGVKVVRDLTEIENHLNL